MSILIENISKNFGKKSIVSKINLEIESGKIAALLGPSGSGKSTLLRTIAGFLKPDTGRVWFLRKNVTLLPVRKRKIGFVSQDCSLFPKMTVLENINFGLNKEKVQYSSRLNNLLDLLKLRKFLKFYPNQLSGGQKQRVAFTRALVLEPTTLLLDEPFSALDIKLKNTLKSWIKDLHSEKDVTSIIITHDIHEAMETSDVVIILKDGVVEQFGSPEEIYKYPATPFIKNFLKI